MISMLSISSILFCGWTLAWLDINYLNALFVFLIGQLLFHHFVLEQILRFIHMVGWVVKTLKKHKHELKTYGYQLLIVLVILLIL